MYDCRKALQEESKRDSNSVIFKLYVLVIGIYAGVQFFISFLMRIPACHLLTNRCDSWPLIRFVKWLRQVFVSSFAFDFVIVLLIPLFLFSYHVWLCWMLTLVLLYWQMKERYYVGRGMYERSLDFIKYALDIFFSLFCFFSFSTYNTCSILLPLPIHFSEKFRGIMCSN